MNIDLCSIHASKWNFWISVGNIIIFNKAGALFGLQLNKQTFNITILFVVLEYKF